MTNDDLLKKLARTDLNLLPVLMVLIETGSTQATADRIGRTQSAVSHALNRLRDLLGDPLFVRHGPKLVPTPLVANLRDPLVRLLHEATRLVDQGRDFDPAEAKRQVVIGAPDLALPLAQHVIEALKIQGPGLSFQLTNHRHGNTRLMNGEVDLLISLYRHEPRPGTDMTVIGQDDWCFYANPDIGLPDRPTAEDWISRGHIQVFTGPRGRTPIEDAARLAGVTRQVELQVSGFLEALYLAGSAGLFFTNFNALVRPSAERMGLRRFPLPFQVAPAPVVVITRDGKHDAYSRWLGQVAAEAGRAYFG